MRPLSPLWAIVFGLLLAAGQAEAKKKYKHPLGFKVDLPDGWTAETAELGATIAPAGVKVDPGREDNPEVYSLWAVEAEQTSEQEYIQSLRERLKNSRINVDRGGDLEGFSTPGRAGVIYTFDFIHPERKSPYRVRVFAMQRKGKSLLLVATGQREKLAVRDNALRAIARSIDW
jgi:hypothetical protein